jgi:hypothetical protein
MLRNCRRVLADSAESKLVLVLHGRPRPGPSQWSAPDVAAPETKAVLSRAVTVYRAKHRVCRLNVCR